MAPRRRSRRHHEEEHENHERWLVTYADMVTLLMVLFIVMFAISQVDQKKFAELAEGLAEDFGPRDVVQTGSPSILDDNGPAPASFNLAAQVGARPDEPRGKAEEGVKERDGEMTVDETTAAALAAAGRERQSLENARKRIAEALRKAGLRSSVRLAISERGLTVSIVTDRVFFRAHRADLERPGRRLLDAVAPALRDLPNPVSVEGHTNTVPVAPKFYPTEWELSSARAVTVVRYLAERKGIPGRRLAAAGFADQHPLLPPSDPRAADVNRRVDVVVLSTLTSAQRAALAAAGITAG